jgi:hypothetical protein
MAKAKIDKEISQGKKRVWLKVFTFSIWIYNNKLFLKKQSHRLIIISPVF